VRCNIVYVDGKEIPSRLDQAYEKFDDYDDQNGHWFERDVSRYTETVDGADYDTFHDTDRPSRDERRAKGALLSGDGKDFPLDNTLRNCTNNIDAENKPAANQLPDKIVTTNANPTQAEICLPQRHYVVPE